MFWLGIFLFQSIYKNHKTMYIYKLTNKKNGKVYIGQSCRNPEVRWEEHVKGSLSTDERQKTYLQNAINKHGWDNFLPKIIEVIDVEKGKSFLDEREVKHIIEYESYYKSGKGYNLTLGGSGTKGAGCKSERKKNLSTQTDTYDYANYDMESGKLVNIYQSAREAAKGVGGLRYEHVNAASNWLIGKGKFAKSYKGYIWMKLPNGQNFPEKINIQEWQSKTKQKTNNKQPKSKEVHLDKDLYEIGQYDLFGKLVKIWPNNLSLIEREFKTFFPNDTVKYNSIVNNLKRKSFTAGGYFWKRNKLGESPEKISVMSEYTGFEVIKDLMINQPILMMDENKNVIDEFSSILQIPKNIASSFDKVEIYKSVNNKKKYKNNYWIFKKDINYLGKNPKS